MTRAKPPLFVFCDPRVLALRVGNPPICTPRSVTTPLDLADIEISGIVYRDLSNRTAATVDFFEREYPVCNMGVWYAFGVALFAAIGTFLFVSRVYLS